MSEFPNAIVITGVMGSGKSTACNILKLHGFKVIDADEIAHKALKQNAEKMVQIFGPQILSDGAVDRKKLGEIVFRDSLAKKELESIMHPLIRAEIYAKAKELELKGAPYILDIPLYFESSAYSEFSQVCLIYAPKELCIERIMRRNALGRDEAISRLESQIDIEKKRSLAKFVVDNSKDLAWLNSQIELFLKEIKDKNASLKI